MDNVEKRFKYRGYDFMENSSKNFRGMEILMSTDLKYTVHECFRGTNKNILLISVEIM
jgi:hypothetical protein